MINNICKAIINIINDKQHILIHKLYYTLVLFINDYNKVCTKIMLFMYVNKLMINIYEIHI